VKVRGALFLSILLVLALSATLSPAQAGAYGFADGGSSSNSGGAWGGGGGGGGPFYWYDVHNTAHNSLNYNASLANQLRGQGPAAAGPMTNSVLRPCGADTSADPKCPLWFNGPKEWGNDWSQVLPYGPNGGHVTAQVAIGWNVKVWRENPGAGWDLIFARQIGVNGGTTMQGWPTGDGGSGPYPASGATQAGPFLSQFEDPCRVRWNGGRNGQRNALGQLTNSRTSWVGSDARAFKLGFANDTFRGGCYWEGSQIGPRSFRWNYSAGTKALAQQYHRPANLPNDQFGDGGQAKDLGARRAGLKEAIRIRWRLPANNKPPRLSYVIDGAPGLFYAVQVVAVDQREEIMPYNPHKWVNGSSENYFKAFVANPSGDPTGGCLSGCEQEFKSEEPPVFVDLADQTQLETRQPSEQIVTSGPESDLAMSQAFFPYGAELIHFSPQLRYSAPGMDLYPTSAMHCPDQPSSPPCYANPTDFVKYDAPNWGKDLPRLPGISAPIYRTQRECQQVPNTDAVNARYARVQWIYNTTRAYVGSDYNSFWSYDLVGGSDFLAGQLGVSSQAAWEMLLVNYQYDANVYGWIDSWVPQVPATVTQCQDVVARYKTQETLLPRVTWAQPAQVAGTESSIDPFGITWLQPTLENPCAVEPPLPRGNPQEWPTKPRKCSPNGPVDGNGDGDFTDKVDDPNPQEPGQVFNAWDDYLESRVLWEARWANAYQDPYAIGYINDQLLRCPDGDLNGPPRPSTVGSCQPSSGYYNLASAVLNPAEQHAQGFIQAADAAGAKQRPDRDFPGDLENKAAVRVYLETNRPERVTSANLFERATGEPEPNLIGARQNTITGNIELNYCRQGLPKQAKLNLGPVGESDDIEVKKQWYGSPACKGYTQSWHWNGTDEQDVYHPDWYPNSCNAQSAENPSKPGSSVFPNRNPTTMSGQYSQQLGNWVANIFGAYLGADFYPARARAYSANQVRVGSQVRVPYDGARPGADNGNNEPCVELVWGHYKGGHYIFHNGHPVGWAWDNSQGCKIGIGKWDTELGKRYQEASRWFNPEPYFTGAAGWKCQKWNWGWRTKGYWDVNRFPSPGWGANNSGPRVDGGGYNADFGFQWPTDDSALAENNSGTYWRMRASYEGYTNWVWYSRQRANDQSDPLTAAYIKVFGPRGNR
jgi:hypothetical protein